MSKVFLLVMTDGRRDYIHQTIESAATMLQGPLNGLFIHDDSADEENHQWLREHFPQFTLIYKEERQGFGGAINSTWEHLKQYDFDYLFHLEDDFTFNRRIPLNDMIRVLEENPNVYQMALKRQAWSSEEIRVGGFMERWPESFHQQDGWISHSLFFTSNPSLYRKSLIETKAFPNVKDSEGHFTQEIKNSDSKAEFGYWGNKTDTPWVTHIGTKRKGNIY